MYNNLAAQVRKLKHNFELLEAGLSRANAVGEEELERTRPRPEMRPSSTSAALFSALNLDPGEQFWLAAASTAKSNRAAVLQPLRQEGRPLRVRPAAPGQQHLCWMRYSSC